MKLHEMTLLGFGPKPVSAQTYDGIVKAWGLYGLTPVSNLPDQVAGLSGVVAVDTGGRHSLALKSDGTVWAWGDNYSGQLGNGSTIDSPLPVPVSGLSGMVAVAAGSSHSLAVKSDGSVWAWGFIGTGELGNGTNTGSDLPVPVFLLVGGINAVAAGFAHSLALQVNGTVWAWGINSLGELGNGSYDNNILPVPVSGLSSVVAVAAGSAYSLAVKSDGTVWAWGFNYFGQLGNGGYDHSTLPVPVSGLSGVVAVAASSGHSLAVKSDGTVWAWGSNGYGELGNGTNTDSNVPVQSRLRRALDVVAAIYYCLAITLPELRDIDHIITEIINLQKAGGIDDPEVVTALKNTAAQAQAQLAAGNSPAAINTLTALLHQVRPRAASTSAHPARSAPSRSARRRCCSAESRPSSRILRPPVRRTPSPATP